MNRVMNSESGRAKRSKDTSRPRRACERKKGRSATNEQQGSEGNWIHESVSPMLTQTCSALSEPCACLDGVQEGGLERGGRRLLRHGEAQAVEEPLRAAQYVFT